MWSFQRRFYALQCGFQCAWWALVYAATKKWVYEVNDGSVVVSPGWLVGPASAGNLALWLHRRRRVVYLLMPYALGMAAYGDHATYFFPRYVAALSVSAYHLAETAASRRHGEYGLLYGAWACVLPGPWARGACLGVGVHVIVSAAYAKFRIGGARWLDADTLRTYLDAYRDSKSLAAPYSREASAFCAERVPATLALGCAALEGILAPASLLMLPPVRPLIAFLLVAMHVGIFVVMSRLVGLAFFTSIPAYLAAFSSEPLDGWRAWLFACAIGLGPTLFAHRRGALLPEHWPCSPLALFPWHGSQAAALRLRLMSGDTRLVLATPETAALGLVGARVAYAKPGGPPRPTPSPTARVVHDAVLRVVGFTVAADEGVSALLERADWAPRELCRRVETFLETGRRCVEADTGRCLRRAFFVRVDAKNGREVLEVLENGSYFK